MTDILRSLNTATYGLFALEQPLSLEEIAAGAQRRVFPAAALHTPEWFAAAAEGQDLLAIAPELQPDVVPDEQGQRLAEVDLIRVYGTTRADQPEDDGVSGISPAEQKATLSKPTEDDELHAEPARSSPAVHIGLLKELGELDD